MLTVEQVTAKQQEQRNLQSQLEGHKASAAAKIEQLNTILAKHGVKTVQELMDKRKQHEDAMAVEYQTCQTAIDTLKPQVDKLNSLV